MTLRSFPRCLWSMGLWAGLAVLLRAEPIDLPLYDGPPPGAPLSSEAEVLVRKPGDPIVRITHVQSPAVRVFLPPKESATGAAVVICPGGAYRILAIDHEGWRVAEWLNSIGVAGIVLKYRVSDQMGGAYRHPVPLLDARQAVRLTRSRAAEWGLDPKRIGILGFSAGGHLASTALTLTDTPLPGEDEKAFASRSHRPDFGVLVYPVISLHDTWAHRGSGDNLLGPDATSEGRRSLSTELLVSPATPPTFLVATQDDTGVPLQNAIAFYQAMIVHHVPGELHVWEKGGHGFGLLPSPNAVNTEWPRQLAAWLRGRGLLGK
ncbi:MAG: alpha/beta hydrolase [Verrucomicrobiales bacterium]